MEIVAEKLTGSGRIAISAWAAMRVAARLGIVAIKVGGGERGGDRQIGRDEKGDATALAVIDKNPVERAAGVAARADQHVIAAA